MFIDLIKAFFNSALFQSLNNLIIFDRISPLFFSSDFVLFPSIYVLQLQEQNQRFSFAASRHLNWENIEEYFFSFSRKKRGKHDISFIIDSPFLLEAPAPPFTPSPP